VRERYDFAPSREDLNHDPVWGLVHKW
jgi:hypothetical protein